MADIAILVEGQYVNPTERDWYIDQVLEEDQILIEGFEKNGLTAEKVDWASVKDWSQYKAIVFSSVWDYFHRFKEFSEFLEKVKGAGLFVNAIETIQWNMDKHYLQDLKKKGIPIVESYFIDKGDQRTLAEIHSELGWKKTVVKPCVSGAARHTYKLSPGTIQDVEKTYREVITNESMMLQPFLESITTKGEVSHIVINGKHTHSVLKKAKSGDYRVQDDFGGSVHEYKANEIEIEFAERAVAACSPLPLYARVDVVWDNNDELAIGELELIEPELWFRKNPQAAHQLADAVCNLL